MTETAWRLDSPGGDLALEVALMDPGGPGSSLHYRVLLEGGAEPAAALDWSPVGIRRLDQSFVNGLEVRWVGSGDFDEHYDLAHGKAGRVHSRYRELTLGLGGPEGGEVEVIFRISDRGAAFRYRFPGSEGKLYTVTGEESGFRIPAGSFGYLTPHDAPTRYTPAYEAYYQVDVPVGRPAPTEEGWSFPALFRLPAGAGWVLLTEADLDSSYCGTRLAQDAPGGTYRVRFPSPGEGNGISETDPSYALPWTTPWRVIQAAADLAGIVEATWVTDLSRPAQGVPDWVKPGRVAWSWWSEPESSKSFQKQLPFVDLAAEMGWEYLLVDANWDEMGPDAIPRLVELARDKGVRVLLWYNSGGPHNVVTEKPRDRMFERDARRKEMEWMREVGVAGIKVDFFQSDKQDVIRLYEDILKDAAEFGIMVNFHGCTVPRGWERTYPHLMSMEAVRANESYLFDPAFPERAAAHNAMLPFTRNVVGPMDFTPVALSDSRYPRLTTAAHELAQSVVFAGGWIHFADGVAAYRALEEGTKRLLRAVPAAWDEIRLLAGEPGQYVALARRSGSTWYVGALNGENVPIGIPVGLNFLSGEGTFRAELLTDGAGRDQILYRELRVGAGETITLELAPRGGWVARFEPEP